MPWTWLSKCCQGKLPRCVASDMLLRLHILVSSSSLSHKVASAYWKILWIYGFTKKNSGQCAYLRQVVLDGLSNKIAECLEIPHAWHSEESGFYPFYSPGRLRCKWHEFQLNPIWLKGYLLVLQSLPLPLPRAKIDRTKGSHVVGLGYSVFDKTEQKMFISLDSPQLFKG